MIPGVKIEMGGKEWVVPPLNLKAVQQVEPLLPKLTGGLGADAVNAVVTVVTLGLKRNYPDITEEQVAEMVDLGNMPVIVGAVMSVSGLSPKVATGVGVPAEADAT